MSQDATGTFRGTGPVGAYVQNFEASLPSLYVPPGDVSGEYGPVSLSPAQQAYYNTLSPTQQASYASDLGFAELESGAPGENPQITQPVLPSDTSNLGISNLPGVPGSINQSGLNLSTITDPYAAANAAYLQTEAGQAWKTQQDYNASPEGIAAKLSSDTQAWEGTPAGQEYFQEYQASNPNATEEQAYQALQGGKNIEQLQEYRSEIPRCFELAKSKRLCLYNSTKFEDNLGTEPTSLPQSSKLQRGRLRTKCA